VGPRAYETATTSVVGIQHITSALAAVPAEQFVPDGKLVMLDDDGRSNFAKLARGRIGTDYYAFDLLFSETPTCARSRWMRARATLAHLFRGFAESVRYCDHVVGMGKTFFEAVRDAGLEGIVAKRRGSQYVLNDDWLKNKCMRVHDFVIGGSVRGRMEREGDIGAARRRLS
jgi:bifunctional non-homologous end joining protein LigD